MNASVYDVEGRDRAGNICYRHNHKNYWHIVNYGQTYPREWARRPVDSCHAYCPHKKAVMAMGIRACHVHRVEVIGGLKVRGGLLRDTAS